MMSLDRCRQVTCPTCHAEPGALCVAIYWRRGEVWRNEVHGARRRAAERAS